MVGGLNLEWVKDQFSQTSFQELDRLAEALEPGANRLLSILHFGGRVCPNDPHLRGLKEGLIAGAALDTYVNEPPKGSPLLALENVVTTPYIGSYTDEAIKEMALVSVKNLLSVLEAQKSN